MTGLRQDPCKTITYARVAALAQAKKTGLPRGAWLISSTIVDARNRAPLAARETVREFVNRVGEL
jgi:hypothetical protein